MNEFVWRVEDSLRVHADRLGTPLMEGEESWQMDKRRQGFTIPEHPHPSRIAPTGGPGGRQVNGDSDIEEKLEKMPRSAGRAESSERKTQ
jgi:hypothetical protein